MPLKAFLWATIEKIEKREKKRTFCGQIEQLASLTAHLLCFWENGSLPFDNKNHGEKNHIIFFRQCCLSLLAATWTALQKAGNTHFGGSFVWIAFLLVHKHTDFFFLSAQGGGDDMIKRLRQSNALIAGKREKEANALILFYNIYLVVKQNYNETQGYNSPECIRTASFFHRRIIPKWFI